MGNIYKKTENQLRFPVFIDVLSPKNHPLCDKSGLFSLFERNGIICFFACREDSLNEQNRLFAC